MARRARAHCSVSRPAARRIRPQPQWPAGAPLFISFTRTPSKTDGPCVRCQYSDHGAWECSASIDPLPDPVVVPTVRLGSGSTACVRTLRRSVCSAVSPAGRRNQVSWPATPESSAASKPRGWSPVHFPDRPVRYTVCGGGGIILPACTVVVWGQQRNKSNGDPS